MRLFWLWMYFKAAAIQSPWLNTWSLNPLWGPASPFNPGTGTPQWTLCQHGVAPTMVGRAGVESGIVNIADYFLD